MTKEEIEVIKNEVVSKIIAKGFVLIEADYKHLSFDDILEVIYQVQKSGEYFLDITPTTEKHKAMWILRDDPKNILSKNVMSTNCFIKITTGINILIALIGASFIGISTCNDIKEKKDVQLLKKELRAQSIELQKNRAYIEKIDSSIHRKIALSDSSQNMR